MQSVCAETFQIFLKPWLQGWPLELAVTFTGRSSLKAVSRRSTCIRPENCWFPKTIPEIDLYRFPLVSVQGTITWNSADKRKLSQWNLESPAEKRFNEKTNSRRKVEVEYFQDFQFLNFQFQFFYSLYIYILYFFFFKPF